MTKKHEPNISDSLIINRNELDLELIEQPHKFYEIAEAYAEAVSSRDAASEAIKTIDAEIYFKLRQQYENEGVKITEALLSQKVLTHADHLKAHAIHNQLKLESDKLAALKEAFSQRTYMLRDLVQLHTTGYFTGASVNGNAAEDIRFMNSRSAIVEKNLRR